MNVAKCLAFPRSFSTVPNQSQATKPHNLHYSRPFQPHSFIPHDRLGLAGIQWGEPANGRILHRTQISKPLGHELRGFLFPQVRRKTQVHSHIGRRRGLVGAQGKDVGSEVPEYLVGECID